MSDKTQFGRIGWIDTTVWLVCIPVSDVDTGAAAALCHP